jgi:hypothetical protein
MRLIALKPVKTEEITVPAVADTSREYTELVGRRDELIAKRAAIKSRIELMDRQLRDLPAAQRHTRVAELLDFGKAQAEPPPSQERVNELRADLAALEDALPIIQSRIDRAHQEASAAICTKIKPEHDRRAREICIKLLALHTAMSEYGQLANKMNGADLMWAHLEPAMPLAFGHPSDPYSVIGIHLRRMAEAGHIERNEIPEALRWG